jgi:hypothetical protein
MNGDNVMQSLWDEQLGWSKTADRLKARRSVWRVVVLVLTIVGAAFAILAGRLSEAVNGIPWRILVSIGSTVALTLVPFLTGSFLTPEGTRKWLRARSVSEGMKSEIYKFRAGAAPYDQADASTLLQRNIRSIRGWAKDMERERALVGSVSAPAPGVLDHEAYLESRVYQQIKKYYRPNAQENAKLAERFQMASIASAAIVALLSAVVTMQGGPSSESVGPWIAVLTTVGGSIATYAAGSRYDFQATTYFATAQQLEDLALEWRESGKTAPSREWSELVRACEEVISAENRGWMAKVDQHS